MACISCLHSCSPQSLCPFLWSPVIGRNLFKEVLEKAAILSNPVQEERWWTVIYTLHVFGICPKDLVIVVIYCLWNPSPVHKRLLPFTVSDLTCLVDYAQGLNNTEWSLTPVCYSALQAQERGLVKTGVLWCAQTSLSQSTYCRVLKSSFLLISSVIQDFQPVYIQTNRIYILESCQHFKVWNVLQWL